MVLHLPTVVLPVQTGRATTLEELPPLLLALEACVARDPRPPGFVGTIAIGVEVDDQSWWWVLEADRTAETRFVRSRPVGVDGLVLYSATGATQILAEGEGSGQPEILEVAGDPGMLERFASRYRVARSAAELRGEDVR